MSLVQRFTQNNRYAGGGSTTADAMERRRRSQPPADGFQTGYNPKLAAPGTGIKNTGAMQTWNGIVVTPRPWSGNEMNAFPTTDQFETYEDYQRSVDDWFKDRDLAMADPTWGRSEGPWTPESRGLGSGTAGSGYTSGAPTIDPSAGSTLVQLSPAQQSMYETQMSALRMQEEQARASEIAQRNAALMRSAEMRREALRRAAGARMDMGAAMAESGMYSPALVGIGMDAASGMGMSGVREAMDVRRAALEAYLQNMAGIRTGAAAERAALDAWKAQQIEALTQQPAQNYIMNSPVGGMA